MSHCRRFTEQEDKQLRQMWAAGVAEQEIARILHRQRKSIQSRAKTLGLPKRKPEQVKRDSHLPEKTFAEKRRDHARLVGNLRHRISLNLSDPIIVEYSPGSMFGRTVKRLDADTQALIDRALEERASA